MSSLETGKSEVVRASHILTQQNVLDAFGHFSARDPGADDRFLLSCARSPGLIETADVLEFDLDSELVRPDARKLFLERVIHGEIYRQRSDVGAICHFHAEAIMPFCVSDRELRPVSHVGATMGKIVPRWSAQAEFGDTNLLVATPQQGASLAKTLGTHWCMLLDNHGGVVVGRNVRETVFRAVNMCLNARNQLAAERSGSVRFLTRHEVELASEANLSNGVLARAWELWCSTSSV